VLYADASGAPVTEGHPDMERRTFREVLGEIESGRLSVEAIVLRESGRELPGDISQPLVELYFKGVPTYTLELFHQGLLAKDPALSAEPDLAFFRRDSRSPASPSSNDSSVPPTSRAPCPVSFSPHLCCWWRRWRCASRTGVRLFSASDASAGTGIRSRSSNSAACGCRLRRPSPASGEDAARITRVGRFLRATRIDELPQLWNVLRGEMSLIGPRAEWEDLVRHYEQEIPCYHFRHLVRPGITGWAQVNYPYGATLENTLRKLEFDLYYIRHFSFLLDASIVLKTIHTMLVGKGK
jgi:hypothetical protein